MKTLLLSLVAFLGVVHALHGQHQGGVPVKASFGATAGNTCEPNNTFKPSYTVSLANGIVTITGTTEVRCSPLPVVMADVQGSNLVIKKIDTTSTPSTCNCYKNFSWQITGCSDRSYTVVVEAYGTSSRYDTLVTASNPPCDTLPAPPELPLSSYGSVGSALSISVLDSTNGGSITWYRDQLIVGTGNTLHYVPNSKNMYTFTATRTVGGCTSNPSSISSAVDIACMTVVQDSSTIDTDFSKVITLVGENKYTQWFFNNAMSPAPRSFSYSFIPGEFSSSETLTVRAISTIKTCLSKLYTYHLHQKTSDKVPVPVLPTIANAMVGYPYTIRVQDSLVGGLITWYANTLDNPIGKGNSVTFTPDKKEKMSILAVRSLDNMRSATAIATFYVAPQCIPVFPALALEQVIHVCENNDTVTIGNFSPETMWTSELSDSVIFVGSTLHMHFNFDSTLKIYASTLINECSPPAVRPYKVVKQKAITTIISSIVCEGDTVIFNSKLQNVVLGNLVSLDTISSTKAIVTKGNRGPTNEDLFIHYSNVNPDNSCNMVLYQVTVLPRPRLEIMTTDVPVVCMTPGLFPAVPNRLKEFNNLNGRLFSLPSDNVQNEHIVNISADQTIGVTYQFEADNGCTSLPVSDLVRVNMAPTVSGPRCGRCDASPRLCANTTFPRNTRSMFDFTVSSSTPVDTSFATSSYMTSTGEFNPSSKDSLFPVTMILTSRSGCSTTYHDKIVLIQQPVLQPITLSGTIDRVPALEMLPTAGGIINWYANDNTLSKHLHTGTSFNTGINLPGQYTFLVTETVSICQSNPVTTTLNIGLNTGQFSIKGHVKANNAPLTTGSVELFRALGSRFVVQGMEPINSDGSFMFSDLASGKYIILAIPGTSDQASILPTYYYNATTWNEAYVLNLEGTAEGMTVTMATFTKETSGKGAITGIVAVENGLINSPILKTYSQFMLPVVVTRDGTTVAYGIPDANGHFSIDNLPDGTYQVSLDVPGHTMSTRTVIISNATSQPVSFLVKQDYVTSSIIGEPSTTTLHPNPASTTVRIKTSSPLRSINIFSPAGVLVLSSKHEDISISSLPAGIYRVQIITRDESVTRSLIVK